MPDKSIDQNTKAMHFVPIYRYVVVVSLIVLGYVFAVTFLPLPKENQRFVDIAFGFLLNLLANNSSYLTGGNPMATLKKGDVVAAALPAGSKTVVTTEQLGPDLDIKEKENENEETN